MLSGATMRKSPSHIHQTLRPASGPDEARGRDRSPPQASAYTLPQRAIALDEKRAYPPVLNSHPTMRRRSYGVSCDRNPRLGSGRTIDASCGEGRTRLRELAG
jgi:hypothetical protein